MKPRPTAGAGVRFRGTNLWSPTLPLNPTLDNDSSHGIGSTANRLNCQLAKFTVSGTNTWYLTNSDGALRVFQERSFPLTNSSAYDRLRPYLCPGPIAAATITASSMGPMQLKLITATFAES